MLRSLKQLQGRLLQVSQDLLYLNRYVSAAACQNHPNPLRKYAGKVYSQSDEDGISFEILRRIGVGKGVFAEFGVDTGTENNTLALAAAGWSGFWVGGQDLAYDFDPNRARLLNFHYQKAWITRANIVDLYRDGLTKIRQLECDLISLDLDGNDYYFVETLLKNGARPKVFIVEYNAKFMPPIKFVIDYDDDHRWAGDDYFGASLSSFFELFESHDYLLACCTTAGTNAFFVQNEFRDAFTDIPPELEQLYAAPRYFLVGLDAFGHPQSPKTIAKIFSLLNSDA